MANTQTLIAQAYSAFNQRNIDGVLALMSENVSWPRASEGGRVIGKEEIRAYWTRQWQEFDPHVEPMEVIEREGGKTEVRVHQLVKSLGGEVLSDSEVWHVYTIANGLIERMDMASKEAKRARPEIHLRHFPGTSVERRAPGVRAGSPAIASWTRSLIGDRCPAAPEGRDGRPKKRPAGSKVAPCGAAFFHGLKAVASTVVLLRRT